MARAQIALIIPLGDAPGYIPGHPDQGLPGGPETQPPGIWPNPGYPDQGLPGRPPHVGNRPPGSWNPEYPSTGPVRPGRPVDPSWGLEEGGPDQGLPPTRPGVPAQPWVPPAGEELPPPPEDIAHEVVLAIWNPSTQTWTVKTKPPVQPAPHG
jgi:hypothetical protein